MKTNLFNFKRVGLLFQRYFIERFRTELIYWGIMAIVFMFLRNNTSAMSGLIIVAGVFYAARFIKEIHHSANGIAYYMIPATQLEKMTVAIAMTSFYYFVMMIIVYVIGNLAGTFLGNTLAGMDFLPNGLFHHSSLQWTLFGETNSKLPFEMTGAKNQFIVTFFTTFLMVQSLFLLGGIYFKNKQVSKTFFSVLIIQLLLAILIFAEIRLILGDNLHITEMNTKNLNFSPIISDILRILFLLFFWVVSYFRLTEKQV